MKYHQDWHQYTVLGVSIKARYGHFENTIWKRSVFLFPVWGAVWGCHETIKHLANIAFLLVVFECHIFEVSQIHKKPAVPNFHIAVS